MSVIKIPQTEAPGPTPEQLCAITGQDPEGILCSGGKIKHFSEGWAKPVWGKSEKSHYFKRVDATTVKSLCNIETAAQNLYGAGNFPHCSKCEKALAVRIKARSFIGSGRK